MLTTYQTRALNAQNKRLLGANKHKTLVFPFVFSNGATSRANQALGQFGQLRRLFDGRNSVLVRWLNATLNPVGEGDKIKLQFQKGVAFEAFNYSHQLFNQFIRDEATGTVELLNHKTLRLVLDKGQIDAGLKQSFASFFGSATTAVVPSIDDHWLSILYYIPELSEHDLFFVENATLFKQLDGAINQAELSLRSITTELRQSGRAMEQWINGAVAGERYPMPELDATAEGGYKLALKANSGAVFVQIETDDAIALNSLLIVGRRVEGVDELGIPRRLGFAYPIQPIFNTTRRSNYYVREFQMATADILNDFYDPSASPEVVRALERFYNPIQKRDTTAFLNLSLASNSQTPINGAIEHRINGEQWAQKRISPFNLPVRFGPLKSSPSEQYGFKLNAKGVQEPNWTQTLAINSFLDFLNLNAVSFQFNNDFQIGNKVYSQSALGLFSNLINSAVMGGSAIAGGFLGAQTGSASGQLVGAAVGGFLGQAATKVLDLFGKPGSTNTRVENAPSFKWSFLVPTMLVQKMTHIFGQAKLPVQLLFGERNALTALGIGKLPYVLTFRLTDRLKGQNGKTTLDLESKGNGGLDLRSHYQLEADTATYAIDFWRLVALGKTNFRLSFYDKDKHLVYTTYQQTQAQFSDVGLEGSTEGAISDYQTVSGTLPIGFNNMLDPKQVPTNLIPVLSAAALKDADLAIPIREGLDDSNTSSIAVPVSTQPEWVSINGPDRVVRVKSAYDLNQAFKLGFQIKLTYTVQLSGSHHPIKDAVGTPSYLPVINSMQATRTVVFDNAVGKAGQFRPQAQVVSLELNNSTLPTRQMRLVSGSHQYYFNSQCLIGFKLTMEPMGSDWVEFRFSNGNVRNQHTHNARTSGRYLVFNRQVMPPAVVNDDGLSVNGQFHLSLINLSINTEAN